METVYEELVELGKYLSDSNYVKGSSGNLSVRLKNNSFLATPTGADLAGLDKAELSVLDMDGNHLEGAKPSKEIPFHRAVYVNSEAKAVIHLHSTYITALSCLEDLDSENVIKPFTPYIVMKAGKIPLIPYLKPGSHKIAEYVSHLCKENRAMVLANHGVIVTGSSIKDALTVFEEIEETAKLFWILRNEKVRFLTEDNINELR